MLVRNNVLNEINKEGTLTQGSNNCRKIKRKLSQNLDDLQNLLITLTVKVSSEKAWLGLLYEFPLSLNPGDKSNDAQAWKKYSSLYPVSTEDQFQANSKKYWWIIGIKIKSTKYQYESFVWGTQQQNLHLLYLNLT